MKLTWRKVAAAGGIACVATIGIIELKRLNAPSATAPSAVDVGAPVVMLESEPPSPWKPASELDDETAGIDPDVMLPAKLQLTAFAAADIEFAAAPIPQTKKESPATETGELRNPSREELLLHIARNARKRKDYDESAKFYRRTIELQKDRAELQYEFAELLAEAGKVAELKAQLEKIEKNLPPKDDAARKRLAELKNHEGKKPTPPVATNPTPPKPPTPTIPVTPPPVAQVPKGTAKIESEAPGKTAETSMAAEKSVAKTLPAKSSPVKPTDAPPKPVALKNDKKSFDSLDPPSVPAPAALTKADPAKKSGASADAFAAPQPFHPPTLEDYERAIAANPDDAKAKLGLARLKLENWRCGEAGDLLADASPTLANDREYRLTIAWRHAIIGEYNDAKCLLQRLLDERPDDSASMLALADLYFLAEDYHRALGEYGKICDCIPESNDALLGAAHALMKLRRYDDAFLCCNRRLAICPESTEGLIILTETLRRNGKIDEALSRCKKAVAALPDDHPAADAIRLQIAKLLIHKGRTAEARCEFEHLALTAFGNHPIVVWGLWAFPGKGDDKKRPPAPPVPPEDVNFAVTVSDFFVELGRYGDAVGLLEQASAASPSDILLLNRLGDARSHFPTGTGRYSAMDSYMRALTLSPNNSHAMLGYARAARYAGLLQEALDAADRLIKLDANDVPARFEKARTLYAMRRYADADAVYAQAAGTPVEEQLRRELGKLCETLPQDKQPLLMPALTADPQHLREVMLVAAQQDESLREELNRLSADYDAAQTMRSGFATERNIKAFSEWAPIRGIDAGMKRLQTNPLDDETAFDLARNYSQLNSTREAEKLYQKVLTSSPNHYVARTAFDRLCLEHGPQLTVDGDYFRERGRQGLTDIDRYRLQGWAKLNIGDEDEYIAVGEGWLHDTLSNAPDLNGTVASVRAQFKPFDLLLVHVQLNGETYDDRFRDRLTYDAGASWRASDCLRVYGSIYANNVAENAESIQQDIHRSGLMAGADYSPNRCDDLGGFYRFADYSDNNQMNEFDLYASHRLSLWPDELKLIGDVHYWSYDSGTMFDPGLPFGAPPLFGTVHPYFAPGGYTIFSSHLEWKKALSCDVFKEADLTWIGLRGGAGVDSDGVAFAFGRAIFHRDFCYWLSFHTELGFTESKVYRDVSAYAYLTARLKHFAK